LDADPPA
jgi:acetoacetate decarboxylase